MPTARPTGTGRTITAESPLRDVIADIPPGPTSPPPGDIEVGTARVRRSIRSLHGWVSQRPWLVRLARAVPAAFVMLALTLRGLGSRVMWNDEYATWYAATLPRADLLRLLNHVDIVMTPYYLFMRGWIGVFGDSEFSLRLPSVIGMAAAAALTTMLGERLFNKWVGIGAGVLFAVVPSVSRYAQEARGYGLAVAGALLATLLLLRALEKPTWARWGWYGLAMVLTGSAHLVALLVLIPHLFAVLAQARERDPRLWRWLGVAGVIGALFVPMVVKASTETGAIAWITDSQEMVRSFPTQLMGSGAVAQALIGLGLLGAVLMLRSRRRTVLFLLCWAVVPAVFSYVTFDILHLFLFRYFLFTVPAFCLLAATAGDACVRWVAGRRASSPAAQSLISQGLAVAATAVIVVGVWQVGQPGQHAARYSPPPGQPNFRAAAAQISADLRPDDGVVYGFTYHDDGRIGMAYEMRGRPMPKDVLLAQTSQAIGQFDALECANPAACVGGTKRIWLVIADVTTGDPYLPLPADTAQVLRNEFSITHRWAGYHIAVYLLVRNPS
jgi:mannosyltransferase